MRDLTSGVQDAIDADQVSPILLFEAEFVSGYVRVWSGYGDLTWNSQTWNGVGILGGISNIEETSEVKAAGITVSLSGIPSQYISIALQDVRQGKTGKIYLGFMDNSNEVIVDPYLAFEGRLDIPSIQEDGDNSIITISYESRLIDLERSREVRYTHEEQTRLFPGDLGFEYVASMQEKEVLWGRA